MPTHLLYLPKAYFSVGTVATVHRVFAEEDNTFSMSCLDAGGDKVYGVFTAGYSGDGGGAFTVEVLVSGAYQPAVYNGSNIWEWTAPAPASGGWIGDCDGCSCGAEECDRRLTAVKRWQGWFKWNEDPTVSFLTTRYRRLTVTTEYTVSGEAFQGNGDYLYVDSTYVPDPTDVVVGNVPCPCGSATLVNVYQTAGGSPANYAFWEGGTFTRVVTAEVARVEPRTSAGSGYHGWPFAGPLPSGHPGVPAVGPNTVVITETPVEGEVYTYAETHPAACDGCSGPAETQSAVWAEQAPALAGYDCPPCFNPVKFFIDEQVGFDTLESSVVSGDGLTLTTTYSGVIPGTYPAESAVSVTVTAVLSEPYTLADAMNDADGLLLNVALDGEVAFLKTCAGADCPVGCNGWPLVPTDRNNDLRLQEDWVCAGSQEFDVDFMGTGLVDDVVAQRMVYDTGTSAYVVVTRSSWVPSGNSLRTIPYTKPNNLTETAGTPVDVGLTDGVRITSSPGSYPSLEMQWRI